MNRRYLRGRHFGAVQYRKQLSDKKRLFEGRWVGLHLTDVVRKLGLSRYPGFGGKVSISVFRKLPALNRIFAIESRAGIRSRVVLEHRKCLFKVLLEL